MSEKLRFAVPNGSLWDRLCMHLATAGYPLRSPDRTGLCGEADGIQFHQLDRRMIPSFMETGQFHAGLTGLDLWENSGVHDGLRVIDQLRVLADHRPAVAMGAGHEERDATSTVGLSGWPASCPGWPSSSWPGPSLPSHREVVRIDGSEEMCVKYGIADAVLVVTETGRSIRENGLEILPGCDSLLVSKPEIRALPDLSREQGRLAPGAQPRTSSGGQRPGVHHGLVRHPGLGGPACPAPAGVGGPHGLTADRPALEGVRDLHSPVRFRARRSSGSSARGPEASS